MTDLGLPDDARVICAYRDGEFILTHHDTKLKASDEVVILTHSRNLQDLRKRWSPRVADSSEETLEESPSSNS